MIKIIKEKFIILNDLWAESRMRKNSRIQKIEKIAEKMQERR